MRILFVHRRSLSDSKLPSRSINARFIPILEKLKSMQKIDYEVVQESELSNAHLAKCDVVLFCKHTSDHSLAEFKRAKDLEKFVVYDLDDWIFDLPSYSVTNLAENNLKNSIYMLENADLVTVSSGPLLKKVRVINKNAKILGTGFDHRAINPKFDFNLENEQPTIIYSNTDGVKLINGRQEFFEALIDFFDENRDLSLDFWGDNFRELKYISRVNPRGYITNFEYKKEITKANYMFGVIPLGGEEDIDQLFFNSCKTPVKYIDYGGCCIAGIYSDTPIYKDIVTSGINGLVSHNNYSSWKEALDTMLNNSEIRAKIRFNAYQDTLERFSLSSVAKSFLKIIQESQ